MPKRLNWFTSQKERLHSSPPCQKTGSIPTMPKRLNWFTSQKERVLGCIFDVALTTFIFCFLPSSSRFVRFRITCCSTIFAKYDKDITRIYMNIVKRLFSFISLQTRGWFASYLHWVSRLTIAFKFVGETVTETKFVMFAMMASSIIGVDRRVHTHQEIR